MAEKKLMDELERMARRGGKGEAPGGFYSPEGDCIFYFHEDVPHRAQRINSLLTVYRAEDNRRVIGVEIKGVKRLARGGAANVFFEGGRVSIVPLIVETWRSDPVEEVYGPSPEMPARSSFGSRRSTEPSRSRLSDYFDAINAFSPTVHAEGLHVAAGE